MHIYQLGWDWKNPDNSVIERPDGHFGTHLILIRTKGRVVVNSQEYRVKENTVFLLDSCMSHALYADDGEYAFDWIRFSFEKADLALLDSLNLQFNVPIQLKDNAVSMLIAACEEIFNSDAAVKNESLDYIMRAILRHISGHSCTKTKNEQNYYKERLAGLRRNIYDMPANNWNIPDMAKELNVSVSHFQRLYKKKFGVSCMNDVFVSRMQYAKQLLLKSELSAKEIAVMCGYQNYEYFSRSFNRFACESPVRFREKHKENEIDS